MLALLLIALCVGLRVVPHPPNIHGYDAFGWGSLFIYGGFVAQVLIARALRRVRGGAIAATLEAPAL